MVRNIKSITNDELKKAYESNKDFREYVDKSKFPSLDIAFQNMMVKYYYLYLLETPQTSSV
jgi:hypothetical protein